MAAEVRYFAHMAPAGAALLLVPSRLVNLYEEAPRVRAGEAAAEAAEAAEAAAAEPDQDREPEVRIGNRVGLYTRIAKLKP